MMQRRSMIRVGMVAAAVVMVHGGLWLLAVERIAAEYAVQTRVAAAEGWQITAGEIRRAGWPVAARVAIAGIEITDPARRFIWRSEAMLVGIGLRHPTRLAVDLVGPHTLRLEVQENIPITSTRFAVLVTLLGPPVTADLAVRDFSAVVPGGEVKLAALDLQAAYRPAALRGEAALTLTGTARGIDLPAVFAPTLDRHIERMELDATLTGPLPADPGAASPHDAAAAWRDGSGQLTVRRLALDWGKLAMTAAATLGLDAGLQPQGAGTLRAAGVAETLDALVKAEIVPAATAQAAKAVLMLMARDVDGEMELPVALRKGMLTVGRFPLARLPEFIWPDRL